MMSRRANVRRLVISLPLFLLYLRGEHQLNYCVVTGEVPEDAEVVDVKFEWATQQVTLYIVSDEFTPVPEGAEIPRFIPAILRPRGRQG